MSVMYCLESKQEDSRKDKQGRLAEIDAERVSVPARAFRCVSSATSPDANELTSIHEQDRWED